MKKLAYITAALLVATVAIGYAGALAKSDMGTVGASGSTTATAVVPPNDGLIAVAGLSYGVNTNIVCITKYMPDIITSAQYLSAGTSLKVAFDSDGTLNGYTPDGTNDNLLVQTTTGLALRSVTGLTTNNVDASSASGYSRTYTVASTTCATGAVVYLVKPANVVRDVFPAGTLVANWQNVCAGYRNFPLAIGVTSAVPGAAVGVFYEVWK
jgi:hypothetical protein